MLYAHLDEEIVAKDKDALEVASDGTQGITTFPRPFTLLFEVLAYPEAERAHDLEGSQSASEAEQGGMSYFFKNLHLIHLN